MIYESSTGGSRNQLTDSAPVNAAKVALRLFHHPRPSEVTCTYFRNQDILYLHYDLHDVNRWELPPPASSPNPKENLWQATCFEFFASRGPRYCEWNLSPSGDWAFYQFASYRVAAPAYPANKPLILGKFGRQFRYGLSLKTMRESLGGDPEAVQISAVLKDQRGKLSYAAVAHHGNQPDFHDQSAFVLPWPDPIDWST